MKKRHRLNNGEKRQEISYTSGIFVTFKIRPSNAEVRRPGQARHTRLRNYYGNLATSAGWAHPFTVTVETRCMWVYVCYTSVDVPVISEEPRIMCVCMCVCVLYSSIATRRPFTYLPWKPEFMSMLCFICPFVRLNSVYWRYLPSANDR
jgi:hypothetical protein